MVPRWRASAAGCNGSIEAAPRLRQAAWESAMMPAVAPPLEPTLPRCWLPPPSSAGTRSGAACARSPPSSRASGPSGTPPPTTPATRWAAAQLGPFALHRDCRWPVVPRSGTGTCADRPCAPSLAPLPAVRHPRPLLPHVRRHLHQVRALRRPRQQRHLLSTTTVRSFAVACTLSTSPLSLIF